MSTSARLSLSSLRSPVSLIQSSSYFLFLNAADVPCPRYCRPFPFAHRREKESPNLPRPRTFHSGLGQNLFGTYECDTSLLKPSCDSSFQTSDESNGSPFSTTRSFLPPPSPETHLTPQSSPATTEDERASATLQYVSTTRQARSASRVGPRRPRSRVISTASTQTTFTHLSATRERHPWSPAFNTQQHPNRVTRTPRSPATELHGHHPFGSQDVLKLRTGSLNTRCPPQLEDHLELRTPTSPLLGCCGPIEGIRIASPVRRPEHFPPLDTTTSLKSWRLCASSTAPG